MVPVGLEGGAGVVEGLHLGEGQPEREGGFGALVLVGPVGMQSVTTTAGRRVVKTFSEVIGAEEPVEAAGGFGAPMAVTGAVEGFDAGADRGSGFDRLLVEFRRGASLEPEAVGADGAEATAFAALVVHEPAQGTEPGVAHLVIVGPTSGQNEGVTEAWIVISDNVLEPRPVVRRGALPEFEEAGGKFFAEARGEQVAVESAEVFVQS